MELGALIFYTVIHILAQTKIMCYNNRKRSEVMNMLEKMSDFFENRLDGYDEHMLRDIESAEIFYPYTANQLPKEKDCTILDLGCGTGLELEFYFKLNPTARVTGIDLCVPMLDRLKEKFADKQIKLIVGSYFDVPLGANIYAAAVSVESLHHFTKEIKIPLYKKLYSALKENGYFVLTDYFAPDDSYETFYFSELARLKREAGISDSDFYHYDTPLTVAHETEALNAGGFRRVEIKQNWGNTYTLIAYK